MCQSGSHITKIFRLMVGGSSPGTEGSKWPPSMVFLLTSFLSSAEASGVLIFWSRWTAFFNHITSKNSFLVFSVHNALTTTPFQANSQAWDTEELNRAAVEAYCTNPLYEYRAVPGPHHVHLNNPEIVAGPIAAFLERHNNLGGGDSHSHNHS